MRSPRSLDSDRGSNSQDHQGSGWVLKPEQEGPSGHRAGQVCRETPGPQGIPVGERAAGRGRGRGSGAALRLGGMYSGHQGSAWVWAQMPQPWGSQRGQWEASRKDDWLPWGGSLGGSSALGSKARQQREQLNLQVSIHPTRTQRAEGLDTRASLGTRRNFSTSNCCAVDWPARES